MPEAGTITKDIWGSGGQRTPALRPQRVSFTAPVKKKAPAPYPIWYFHPDRLGLKEPPKDFVRQLHEIDENLGVSWHPLKRRWQIWQKSLTPLPDYTGGWKLLFTVEHLGEYMPLDQRVFWYLHSIDSRQYSSGADYYRRVEAEMQRVSEAKEKKHENEARDWARDYWKFMGIKNIGKGNKFAEHWSGS